MEIEKVIRVLAIMIVVAAFAVRIATRLMFPDASQASTLPIAIVLILCLGIIWRRTAKEKNSNE